MKKADEPQKRKGRRKREREKKKKIRGKKRSQSRGPGHHHKTLVKIFARVQTAVDKTKLCRDC